MACVVEGGSLWMCVSPPPMQSPSMRSCSIMSSSRACHAHAKHHVTRAYDQEKSQRSSKANTRDRLLLKPCGVLAYL